MQENTYRGFGPEGSSTVGACTGVGNPPLEIGVPTAAEIGVANVGGTGVAAAAPSVSIFTPFAPDDLLLAPDILD